MTTRKSYYKITTRSRVGVVRVDGFQKVSLAAATHSTAPFGKHTEGKTIGGAPLVCATSTPRKLTNSPEPTLVYLFVDGCTWNASHFDGWIATGS